MGLYFSCRVCRLFPDEPFHDASDVESDLAAAGHHVSHSFEFSLAYNLTDVDDDFLQFFNFFYKDRRADLVRVRQVVDELAARGVCETRVKMMMVQRQLPSS